MVGVQVRVAVGVAVSVTVAVHVGVSVGVKKPQASAAPVIKSAPIRSVSVPIGFRLAAIPDPGADNGDPESKATSV
jgi:hypothetical protein